MVDGWTAEHAGEEGGVIVVDICEPNRRADDGQRYVMVRLSDDESGEMRYRGEWQWSRGTWLTFLQMLKPSRALQVNEVALEEWHR